MVKTLTFFNKYVGVSGKKSIPINRATGTKRHRTLKVVQLTIEPMMYTRRIPTDRVNWNSVPKVPLILLSAISEMYMGATTQKLPVAKPEKAKYIIESSSLFKISSFTKAYQ